MKRMIYWFTALGILSACKSEVPGFYNQVTPCDMPIEKKYQGMGPEEVKTVEFQSADTTIQKIVVTYPASLETSNATYPLVNIGNASNTTADLMLEPMKHLSSWGFIVIDNMDAQTGRGTSVSRTLDEFLHLAAQQDNLFLGKVDTERIAIAGFSQGATGTVLAATRFDNSSLYKVIYLCSCPQPELGNNMQWGEIMMQEVNAPLLMLLGTKFFDNKVICPLEIFQQMYADVPAGVPVAQARRVDKDHDKMGGEGDPYMTAWLRYYLMNDAEAGTAFRGSAPELTRNVRWQDVQIKNVK